MAKRERKSRRKVAEPVAVETVEFERLANLIEATSGPMDDLPVERWATLWLPKMPENNSVSDPDFSGNSCGRWVRDRFGAHAWLAVELHAAGDDRARLARLTALGALARVPVSLHCWLPRFRCPAACCALPVAGCQTNMVRTASPGG